MRLTKKSRNYGYKRNPTESFDDCLKKLGQLEDIEDNIGIDLELLFNKATKEVWYKQEIIDYDVGGNWYKELETLITKKLKALEIIKNKVLQINDFDVLEVRETVELNEEECERLEEVLK